MTVFDKAARQWLQEHAADLEPEKLLSEDEKRAACRAFADGRWPVPADAVAAPPFDQIDDEESFNRVIGDPACWQTALSDTLYRGWVLPQAILIFGKRWFDRYKWRPSIQRGLRFPLFSEQERAEGREGGTLLEDTPAGRMRIARIAARVDHALSMYLEGGGRTVDGAKQPGGYIVDSIKNEFMREIAEEHDYRLERIRACPYCLVRRRGRARKVALVEKGGHMYSCERCAAAAENLTNSLDRAEDAEKRRLKQEIKRLSLFALMSGAACICPAEGCPGRFVPMNAVADEAWWDTTEGRSAAKMLASRRPLKGAARCRRPPQEFLNVPLECPYCGQHFTPASAAHNSDSDAGMMTGLPTVFVWRAQNLGELDKPDAVKGVGGRRIKSPPSLKDSLAGEPSNVEHLIAARQHARILAGELALCAVDAGGPTASAIMSRCFYHGAADWVLRHPEDASAYFLDWSADPDRKGRAVTRVIKGQDASIHQGLVRAWMARLEQALPELRHAKGRHMRSLADLPWLCHPPKCRNGPRAAFETTIGAGLRIPNKSGLGQGSARPRIAWIISLRDEKGRDLIPLMRDYEWHAIFMRPDSGLRPGTIVKVEALMMPGHRCHAPIQRIVRLRTAALAPMIARIRREEESGEADRAFWTAWRQKARLAMRNLDIDDQQGEQV